MSIHAIASSHIYIVKIEEPYLEKIFGEDVSGTNLEA